MKKYIFAFSLISLTTSVGAVAMNLEGSCAGKLSDGSPLVFQYYSNFDGCKVSARAAISYQYGREGMVTGKRSFTEKSDIYSFGSTRLIFPNSTGNTHGKYQYIDSSGHRKTVTLACDVRDYEYAECE